MSTPARSWMPAMLMALCLSGSLASDHHAEDDKIGAKIVHEAVHTVTLEPTCYGKVTHFETTIVPTTCYVEVTDYIYINSTLTQKFTESTTEVLHFTVEVTETETDTTGVIVTTTDTVPATVTTTDTDGVTITTTDTDAVTITTTDTDGVTITTTDTDAVTITTTDTVPTTITTTEIETIFSTSYDPCPTWCSVDAATVTVFYWPTDRPYTYPSTYVDEEREFTFTSPSVYLLIPWAKGTNPAGEWVGPSTTDWILGLDLEEVSTIADGPSGSLTRQLMLSDLGTDCPQSVPQTAIATLSDSRCAPILAAPDKVKSWASPCNACGPFGLFDPPYAVPTVTGGLIDKTSSTETFTTTAEGPPPTSGAEGIEEPEPSTAPEVTTQTAEGPGSDALPEPTTQAESPAEPETQTSAGQVSLSETTVPEEVPTSENASPTPPATLPTPVDPENPDNIPGAANRLSGSTWVISLAIMWLVTA